METTSAPQKKNKVLPIVATVIALLIIGYIAKTVIHGMHYEETDNAQLETNIVPVAPRINGFIDKIYVVDNQKVKKGDTLFIIEHTDMSIKVKQAEIALSTALAQIGVIGSSSTAARSSSVAVGSNVATAQANIEAAKVRQTRANLDFDRYQRLFDLQSITKQQFDGAKAEKDAADKQLIIAQSQYNSAKEQGAASNSQAVSVGAQLKPAELLVQQRQQELALANLNLSYAVVIAPLDAVVSKKSLQVGQLVNAGQTLMYLVDDESLWTVANFKETQLAKMKVGQQATVHVDAFGKTNLKGKIESIQNATGGKFSLMPADNASGNFVKVVQRIPVKILLDKEEIKGKAYSAGMNCTVSIKVD